MNPDKSMANKLREELRSGASCAEDMHDDGAGPKSRSL